MRDINEIKEKIHTINPNITDELLDLLYEFFISYHHDKLVSEFKKVENCKKINNITISKLIAK